MATTPNDAATKAALAAANASASTAMSTPATPGTNSAVGDLRTPGTAGSSGTAKKATSKSSTGKKATKKKSQASDSASVTSAASNATNTTSTKKKKAPARKKKTTAKNSKKGAGAGTGGGSSSAAGNAANTAANTRAAILRAQYQALLQDREARHHDAAWLAPLPQPSSSSNNNATPGGAAVQGDSALPNYYQQTHQSPLPFPYSHTSPSFLERDFEIVQRALRANGFGINGNNNNSSSNNSSSQSSDQNKNHNTGNSSSSNNNNMDISLEAFGCLLEQARKYALEILTDAADYAAYANGLSSSNSPTDTLDAMITPSDLKLAAELKHENDNVSSSSYRDDDYTLNALMEISEEMNKKLLPPIPDGCYNGIVLPGDEQDRLMGRTFDIVSGMKIMEYKGITDAIAANQRQRQQDGGENANESSAMDGSKDSSNNRNTSTAPRSIPTHGAHRGRQIPINLTSNNSGDAAAAGPKDGPSDQTGMVID